MLRTKKFSQPKKELSVPLLRESSQKEVLVDVIDRSTDKKIGERVEFVPVSIELSEDSFVSNEPAEIYDIENQLKVGLKPSICPNGGYIHADIDMPFDMESNCAVLLDKVNCKQANKQEEQSSVELEKTE